MNTLPSRYNHQMFSNNLNLFVSHPALHVFNFLHAWPYLIICQWFLYFAKLANIRIVQTSNQVKHIKF